MVKDGNQSEKQFYTGMKSCKHILFLVKKAAQFDVPLFQYIHSLNDAVKFTVLYIESPLKSSSDKELGARSKWGIDLINNYNWHCLDKADSLQIENFISKEQPDIIITNGYQNVYKPYIDVFKRINIPLALRIDSVLSGKSGLNKLVRKLTMRFAYRDFKTLMTTGTKGYEYLDFIGINKSRQSWFPYCVDNDFFATPITNNEWLQVNKIDSELETVIGVCKFIERENPLDLLKAFILINRRDLQLIMVGDGHLRMEMKELANKHPHLKIVFPGYVNYWELPFVYSLASVFVHPALDEPWGVSVQEAMAAGCSVVASSGVGSGYDLIETNKNGFIYETGNLKELSGYIISAINLDTAEVKRTNKRILETWNYRKVWISIKDTCINL